MDKSFDSLGERADVLNNYEIGIETLMRKAIRDALRAKGIKHHVKNGVIIITKQHREDETWRHYFAFDTYANHI